MFSLIAGDEMFLDVEGYEGRYSVSNYGRVYSHKLNREKFLKPYPNKKGYLRVDLYKDGNKKGICIHILVGNAFIGKREGELTFDHMDRNKLNNKASNLRLATKCQQSENTNLRNDNKLGEKNICILIDKRTGYKHYRIEIKRNKKRVFEKQLSSNKFSLEDAKKIRDDFLNTI